MKKNTRRLLAGICIFAAAALILAIVLPDVSQKVLIGVVAVLIAAAAAISHSITKYLMKVALDREVPANIRNLGKAKERLVGSADDEAAVKEMRAAAVRLEESGCETVEIAARDGERLVGHWQECPDAARVVIAMHGWRTSWSSDFGVIADFWQDSGCNVLYAEQRGQNNSGGNYMGFGLLERYDCMDWISWVNERCGKTMPVYLAGVSMGAATVLMAAGFDLPENVCGVIADCGFTAPQAIWKHVAENNLHLSYGIRSAAINDIYRKALNLEDAEYSTTEAMKACSVPVLFIHGTDDAFVPVTMTYENYKACAAPKRLLVVPGADHGMSYYVERENYEQAVLRFWAEFDRPVVNGRSEDREAEKRTPN